VLRGLRQELASCEAAMPTPALTIDTGRGSPDRAAETILAAIGADF